MFMQLKYSKVRRKNCPKHKLIFGQVLKVIYSTVSYSVIVFTLILTLVVSIVIGNKSLTVVQLGIYSWAYFKISHKNGLYQLITGTYQVDRYEIGVKSRVWTLLPAPVERPVENRMDEMFIQIVKGRKHTVTIRLRTFSSFNTYTVYGVVGTFTNLRTKSIILFMLCTLD